MKTSFLACSILLAAAGCSAEQGGLAAANSEAIEARASLVGDVFLSTNTYTYRTYEGNDIQARLRMKFVPATNDGYAYDNQNSVGLDYEVMVEWVDVVTGRAWQLENTYFARNTKANGTYEFFDCDTSRNCSSSYKTDFVLFADGTAQLKNRNIASIIDTDEATVFELQLQPAATTQAK